MTNPHAVPRRRPTRARPRLPRGPKPSSASPEIRSRRSDERAEQKASAPGSPPISPPISPNDEPVRQHSEENLSNESSASKPSGAPKTFDPNTTKTVSIKEAAFRLNKHPDTILRWLRAGRLRGWQIGGRGCTILVSEESVEQALVCPIGPNGRIR